MSSGDSRSSTRTSRKLEVVTESARQQQVGLGSNVNCCLPFSSYQIWMDGSGRLAKGTQQHIQEFDPLNPHPRPQHLVHHRSKGCNSIQSNLRQKWRQSRKRSSLWMHLQRQPNRSLSSKMLCYRKQQHRSTIEPHYLLQHRFEPRHESTGSGRQTASGKTSASSGKTCPLCADEALTGSLQ